MNFEYAYLVIFALLLAVGIFYVSPYELNVNEEDDDE